MKSRDHNDGVAAIEGLEKPLLETRIVGGNGFGKSGIEEGVVLDHVFRHVVGPFEDLGPNVGQKGVGGPTTKDHNFGHRVVHQEQGHGCSGANGFVADV
jgi:hypothetical protein